MIRRISLPALGLLGALCACATPEQLQAEDAAKCTGWGAQAGTPLFAECMVLLGKMRAVENQERSNRLMAAGLATQNAGRAARPSQADGPEPTVFRSGASPGYQCRPAAGDRLNCFPY